MITRGRLTAAGTAIGFSPVPYRLDYKLETRLRFVTSGLLVEARGEGWSRSLDLRRHPSGRWTARTRTRGAVDLPAPGGDTSAYKSALDCDLALSPLTNSMPVLRHGLLSAGGPIDFVMAWVSVPDLAVHSSPQRYTFISREGDRSLVRYESGSRLRCGAGLRLRRIRDRLPGNRPPRQLSFSAARIRSRSDCSGPSRSSRPRNVFTNQPRHPGARWKSQLKRTSVPPASICVSVTCSRLTRPKGRCTVRSIQRRSGSTSTTSIATGHSRP